MVSFLKLKSASDALAAEFEIPLVFLVSLRANLLKLRNRIVCFDSFPKFYEVGESVAFLFDDEFVVCDLL